MSTPYAQLVQLLSPKQILGAWPDVVPLKHILGVPLSLSLALSLLDPHGEAALAGHDHEQIRLMDELCIVLDYEDRPVGAGTKKTCHLMNNIEAGLLHRAFSVFSFNASGKLLLQQRADEKITFPGLWTNTCCSHPLCVPLELGVGSNSTSSDSVSCLENAVAGVKVAAQRKLLHELGVDPANSPLDAFTFLTRIHYKSASTNGEDAGVWGEHEIDYILVIQTPDDVAVTPNPNEVKDYRYVDAAELREMLADPSLQFTPWFKLIAETYLFEWWENLDRLPDFANEKIDRLL